MRFDDDDSDAYPRPALRDDWRDEGIGLGQVAVEFAAGQGKSAMALERSYDVPSFEFAAQFGLRQLPGTLDLVALDGARASATFRVPGPWRGQLLFLRRDLIIAFAGGRRILQAAWGEREVTVDWNSVPPWIQAVHQNYEHIWRDIRVLN
ncbi:MAG: hypothetical protein ACRDRJ_11060 [Streptosporangiaceae bacterium]